MKIAIEAQRIFRKNKHGMDFVALETIRQLQQIDQDNEYYIIVSPGEDRCLNESSNMRIVEVKCPSYPLWEQIGLPMAIRKIKPDLLHCTSNTAPLYCHVPLILTLHDIIFLEKKGGSNQSLYQNLGWHYRRIIVPKILPNCKKIVTVSHFERKRIQESLRLNEKQITTVYNGFSEHFVPTEKWRSITRKYIETDSYFFFLGNTDPKKNTLRILKAYSIYASHSKCPLPLLIGDLKEDAIDYYLNEGNITDIKHLLRFPGYIPNAELPAIYSGARAFIYASLRESFGIPILEAMACNTPVITSNTSAMPEIAGEDAILVDPQNENEIASQLLKLETDQEYHNQQVTYGKNRIKLFSWEKTAEKLLEIYYSIGG